MTEQRVSAARLSDDLLDIADDIRADGYTSTAEVVTGGANLIRALEAEVARLTAERDALREPAAKWRDAERKVETLRAQILHDNGARKRAEAERDALRSALRQITSVASHALLTPETP